MSSSRLIHFRKPLRGLRAVTLITTAFTGAMIAGCQADAGKKADDDLYELVHRYVLASPPLDECIEEWGLGPKGRFEMRLEIHPSGELVPLEVKDGDEDLNRCLKETIPNLRLPEGSVTAVKPVSISIR